MKWYFASRVRHQSQLTKISEFLTGIGESFNSNWIHFGSLKPYLENIDKVQPFAREVIESIFDSDIFVLISDPEGTDMFIELGVALSKKRSQKNMRIYIIGEHSKRSLMQLHPDIVHLNNLAEVFKLEKIDCKNFEIPGFH